MRILLESNHVYPAGGTGPVGFFPNGAATGGSSIVHDTLARGLAELGHEVLYLLPNSQNPKLPPGVTHLTEVVTEVDVFHHYNSQKLFESKALLPILDKGIPWLTSCHNDPLHWGGDSAFIGDNWVFVSQTLARTHGRDRFVLNGIDPAEFCYSEKKQDYVLFMSNMIHMDQVFNKGLDLALSLSRELHFPLRVAGSFRDDDTLTEVSRMCDRQDAVFCGEVRGAAKAKLLAKARALLFPTRLNESYGLVIAEALMSGTPVISSNKGACSELVTAGTGFVCAGRGDYRRAFAQLDQIPPAACRAFAMERLHYRQMASAFEVEYRRQIQHMRGSGP